MRQRTLAGFHLTRQLSHLASDILHAFFVFSPFPGFFLRDSLSRAVFLDTGPIFLLFPPFPAPPPAVPVQGSLDPQEDQHRTSQWHKGRQGAACKGDEAVKRGLPCPFHGPSLSAGRRVSSSMTLRQGHVARNPNEGWGRPGSLVHSGALLCPQLSQTKKSADLSRMIKSSHGPLDLCLLSIMRLTGRAYTLAVNRKATAISSNLVSYRTPNILMSCMLSCIYPCSTPMRREPKQELRQALWLPSTVPRRHHRAPGHQLPCGEKTLP